MKIILFTLMSLAAISSSASKPIQMDSIGYGNLLHITGNIELPKEHRLNKGAPSKISVFEKSDSDWTLTETVNLNDFFTLTEMIRFQKPIKLKSDRSEIKLAVNLYHCPADHKGLCVIDDFEGFIKRDSHKTASEVQLHILGTDPKKY